MSVLVRMDMPKSCDTCPCLDDYGDYPRCRISEEQRGYSFPILEKRMPNCPIICSLPEGHGRLVDADELRREMYHEAFETDTNMQKWDSGCWIRYKMFENTIGAVPTIVQAEAERSET